jgi:hypothetical protein
VRRELVAARIVGLARELRRLLNGVRQFVGKQSQASRGVVVVRAISEDDMISDREGVSLDGGGRIGRVLAGVNSDLAQVVAGTGRCFSRIVFVPEESVSELIGLLFKTVAGLRHRQLRVRRNWRSYIPQAVPRSAEARLKERAD